MQGADDPPPQPILSPAERYSEILFGLIMALGFTCTLSVAEAGEAEVRTMLFAALGCNVAWGVVDGLMYVLDAVTTRGRDYALLRRFQGAPDAATADRVLGDALPDILRRTLTPTDVDTLRTRLATLPAAPAGPRVRVADVRGALLVALLVMASTIPVAVPFLLMHDPGRALRASNAVAVGLLFVMGLQWGRYAGARPIPMALWMVAIGLTCVGVTIGLGG